jgi:hypothetical protein
MAAATTLVTPSHAGDKARLKELVGAYFELQGNESPAPKPSGIDDVRNAVEEFCYSTGRPTAHALKNNDGSLNTEKAKAYFESQILTPERKNELFAAYSKEMNVAEMVFSTCACCNIRRLHPQNSSRDNWKDADKRWKSLAFTSLRKLVIPDAVMQTRSAIPEWARSTFHMLEHEGLWY